jgi:hypothetical protein
MNQKIKYRYFQVDKIAYIFKKGNNYYPIVAFTKKDIFSESTEIIRIFNKTKNIEQFINFSIEETEENIVMARAKQHGFSMETYFINRRGLAYAMLLRNSDKYVYIPMTPRYISETKLHVFDRREYNLDPEDLEKIIHKTLSARNRLVEFEEKIIGVIIDNNLYYFNPTEKEKAKELFNFHVMKFTIAPETINSNILLNDLQYSPIALTNISDAFYKQYIYRYILIEFIRYINGTKNEKLRNSIVTQIYNIDIKRNPKQFLTFLKTILKEFPADLKLMLNQLNDCFSNFSRTKLIGIINETIYMFDRQIFANLKTRNPSELKTEILAIFKKIIIEKDLPKGNSSNIYMSCKCDERRECSNGKLIFDEKLVGASLEAFAELLANDMVNPLKEPIFLMKYPLDNVVQYFDFEKSQQENINISIYGSN